MNYNEQIKSIPNDKMELIIKFGVRSNSINNIECKPLIDFSYKIVKVEVPELLKENKYIEIARLLFKKKLKKKLLNHLDIKEVQLVYQINKLLIMKALNKL